MDRKDSLMLQYLGKILIIRVKIAFYWGVPNFLWYLPYSKDFYSLYLSRTDDIPYEGSTLHEIFGLFST
jgi:hypothetical protein